MPSLKELTVALGLLASEDDPALNADGWQNYVWRVRPADQCLSYQGSFCKLVVDRWDWKRPQRYEFSFSADGPTNTITSRVKLENQDPADTDQVCLVASFLDKSGNEIGILFVNWRSIAGRTYTRDAPIKPLAPVSEIATVAVGTKQCEVKSVSDAENFYRIRYRLGQR
ncbi:hypothetical protein [Affinirhizobium pseudoryzae]|uniref:hypothetical protein n=1 Tax=Allorhizobium pseudoryzae TaxID=379684 RepID=UPI0013EA4BD9|nr:hypothetical protein [Allorhizobium pseudoryzae]